jgi:hypothetical protein
MFGIKGSLFITDAAAVLKLILSEFICSTKFCFLASLGFCLK